LFKLSQVGFVNDYYLEFTALANRVVGITVDALLDCFISGLKTNIRRDVIAHSPHSLLKAVSLAKLFEEKYTLPSKPYYPTTYSKHPNTSLATKPTSLPPLLPTPNHRPLPQPPKSSNVKTITPAEMQLRREKGLCYTCDEKFTPTHRCPKKQYLLLHVEDSDDLHQEPEPLNLPHLDSVASQLEHHLSFNALKGSSGLGTMKFQGSINGITVQILLDSGSSDNFLQPRLAHHLRLPVEPAPSF